MTENPDGSVSPQKKSKEEQHARVQYKRSDQLNNSIQKSINIGSKSRNGAVSRLRGKLDEAARINYRKNRGLHSSVLDTSNNNNNINNINNDNNLGAR